MSSFSLELFEDFRVSRFHPTAILILVITPFRQIPTLEHPLETEPKPASRNPILIWLIVSQIMAAASLIFWLLVAGLSVMAFDSGVSAEAWTFVIIVWSYPIWPIAFTIASWIAYARKRDRLAGVLTTFTFLPMLLLLLVIIVGNAWFMYQLQTHPPF
jgi:hypothetical protein